MQLQVFSIRDSKAAFFDKPFYMHSKEEAVRALKNSTDDERSAIRKNPEDYDLYHLGTYDNLQGKFETFDSPQHIVKAAVLLAANSEARPN